MKRAAISFLLAAHIVAITCWSLPITSPLIDFFRGVIRPYFVWTGLFQSWDMFAPNPKSVNSFVEAFIIHGDGKVQDWTFPRMHQLGLMYRYNTERYRKFVRKLPGREESGLDLSRVLRQMVKTQTSANGDLSHGIVS
jgi:hypothetical protein